MDNEYLSTKATRKLLGVTTVTLRNWDRENRIRTTRTPSGLRLYNKQDVHNILGGNHTIKTKKKIAYCRVSSKKQEDDLERQCDFFRHNFPLYEIVTDVGSGINWKRKGLKTILECCMQGGVEELVVAHRDRLCRFGFELVEFILQCNDVKLTVLDTDDDSCSSRDLADDILSIVHVYSCREMGKRRYKSKKDSTVSDIGPEKDTEKVDGDDEVCLQQGVVVPEKSL